MILLNAVADIPLFDGYSVRQFPYLEHWEYITDLLAGKERFPYLPRW